MLLSATTTPNGLVSVEHAPGQDRLPGFPIHWTERQLRIAYEQLQVELRQPAYRRVMSQPLELWACAADRGLPSAFLEWPVGKVSEQSFIDLRTYPSIGSEKLAGLVMLLGRVATGAKARPETRSSAMVHVKNGTAAVRVVNDMEWRQWQATVARRGLADESLGRFVASLQDLPAPLWTTPLEEFLEISLRELRGRQGYGAKRIAAVLQAFHSVQELFGSAPANHRCLIPRRLADAEAWVRAQQKREQPPAREAVERGLVLPLLEQIEHDLGSDSRFLLELRLGIGTPQRSVAEIAELSGVRVRHTYQKLKICTRVVRLRWPQGSDLLRSWLSRVGARQPAPGTKLLRAVASVLIQDPKTRL